MASSVSDDTRPPTPTAMAKSAKIVVAGGFGVGKTTLVAAVSEIASINTDRWMSPNHPVDQMDAGLGKTTTTIGMDFGRITLPGTGLVLHLFGTPGQPRFWPVWDDICRGALAAIVLVDTRPGPIPGGNRIAVSWPAVEYFDLDTDIPFVMAVNRFGGRATHPLPAVRAALRLPAETPITEVDARDPTSVKQTLIFAVRHALNHYQSTDTVPGIRRREPHAEPIGEILTKGHPQ